MILLQNSDDRDVNLIVIDIFGVNIFLNFKKDNSKFRTIYSNVMKKNSKGVSFSPLILITGIYY